MEKTDFLTVFCTYGRLEVVKQTLPSIIKETESNNAKLIVHDCIEDNGRHLDKWSYLDSLQKNHDFLLILSGRMPMAHSRNMCMHLGIDLYLPKYIALLEDDHGYKEGFIVSIISLMKSYYGKKLDNGLLAGMFSGCGVHYYGEKEHTLDGHVYPNINQTNNGMVGGLNSCCRVAPTTHWQNVLKGYDLDEYPISEYQTSGLNHRNYNRGFSTMILEGGDKMFMVPNKGRSDTKPWDNRFTASDPRKQIVSEIKRYPGFHGDKYLQEAVLTCFDKSEAFIETGANIGNSLEFILTNRPKQSDCFSCEPDKVLYKQAVDFLKDKVHEWPLKHRFFNKESLPMLEYIRAFHDFSSATTFWLDSHSDTLWPLKEELEFITGNFNHGYIFIDDFKVPGSSRFGYNTHSTGEEYSFENIKEALSKDCDYRLHYPDYTEKTSTHHPLVGWCMIQFCRKQKEIELKNTKEAKLCI